MDVTSILQEFFSSYIVAWIILLGILIWATWFICSKYTELKHRTDVIGSLPCDEHRRQIHSSTEDLREIKGMLYILTESIDFPSGKVNRRSEQAFSRKHSPRSLNDSGLSLYVRSGGEQLVRENFKELAAYIDTLQPLTALDVEADSIIALRQLSATPKMNAVKDWIYNAPIEKIIDASGAEVDYEITLGDVLFVCSIPLRDRYLALHPEISPKVNN